MILKLLGYVVVLSLVGCVYLTVRKHVSLGSAEQFRGTVTRHVARRGSKGRTVYALEVEYRNQIGTIRRFESRNASSPAERPIGAEVAVFEHPDGASQDLLVFSELYLGYWIWFCVGLFVAGCLAAPMLLRLIYVK